MYVHDADILALPVVHVVQCLIFLDNFLYVVRTGPSRNIQRHQQQNSRSKHKYTFPHEKSTSLKMCSDFESVAYLDVSLIDSRVEFCGENRTFHLVRNFRYSSGQSLMKKITPPDFSSRVVNCRLVYLSSAAITGS